MATMAAGVVKRVLLASPRGYCAGVERAVETVELVSTLRRRFPRVRAPQRDDICYATSNRQWAVKQMLPEVDLLLVIGSAHNPNPNPPLEVAPPRGGESPPLQEETVIDEARP